MTGYGDRPALGQRATELVTDPGSGRTVTRLLPRFDTVSYRDVWSRVRAIAASWRRGTSRPIRPGEAVVTIGFASVDYLTLELACNYLGLVAVPLQHNAPVSRLAPIFAEVEPRVLAVSVEYLDLALDSIQGVDSITDVVVFDHRPEVDDHRDALVRLQRRLTGTGIVVTTLRGLVDRGALLPVEPLHTAGSPDRLAMILYTSGSTGEPKGAMHSEATLSKLWTATLVGGDAHPVFNVNFMPLNHIAGRIPPVSAIQAGGVSYFVPESDLSTLFEDLALVRPTSLVAVPRVIEMLHQHYRGVVDRLVATGVDEVAAHTHAAADLRDNVLGGRVLGGYVSTAPLTAAMRNFLDTVLRVHLTDGYGFTEAGPVARDGVISRPAVIDYKLIDVPELGYFATDKPYPRGELLIKSVTMTSGYYKRPDATVAAFDDGFYRTGDVMAEVAPDRLVYVDRRKNVIKLAQGEFVALAQLEAVYASAALVSQIFVYGSSERASLLAVVVPTPDALTRYEGDDLKQAVAEALQRSAREAELQPYEIPADFLVEVDPFSVANGLLAGAGKQLRPNLIRRYGPRLEQMYADAEAARQTELRELRRIAPTQPVIDTVTRAAASILGVPDVPPDTHFTELGGDSLSALTFSNLLSDLFGSEVPVGVIVSPATDLTGLAAYIENRDVRRPTFAAVHGSDATKIAASELTLDKFIDTATLTAAPGLPRVAGTPRTVLLTGANGWLGRFLALQWLRRLGPVGGRLITIVRGRDDDEARARLMRAFNTDPQLSAEFTEAAADHLEVLVGDIAAPDLGLTQEDWQRLADEVELIVHPAALVNHVLPYQQLFGPNVVGTAELIKLALTTRITPVTYLSTVAVAMGIEDFTEDGDIRDVSPVRSVDDCYANGYGNSKWAGEVLLREAHDLCGLPVAVFRSDMILAHPTYAGQLNAPDMFTRLILSLLVTGIAPRSFYPAGARDTHYDGLPVDFVAEAIATLAPSDGYVSYDVMNPHTDGASLDTIVGWLIEAGNPIELVDDYHDWFCRFEVALTGLPEAQRNQTVLPLLHAFEHPQRPTMVASTDVFRAAVRTARIGAAGDIPHIDQTLITKYVSDLRLLGLL